MASAKPMFVLLAKRFHGLNNNTKANYFNPLRNSGGRLTNECRSNFEGTLKKTSFEQWKKWEKVSLFQFFILNSKEDTKISQNCWLKTMRMWMRNKSTERRHSILPQCLVIKELAFVLRNRWMDNKFNHFKNIFSPFAHLGHENIVKLFIENGANVNVKDRIGYTPLHLSIQFGITSLDIRIKWIFPIIKVNRGSILGNDKVEIPKLLIESNADVNAKCQDGETPLHFAAIYGEFSSAHYS